MAVTYLLEVQSSITRRDIGIIKLNTSAGEPPSAVTLLERFAAIRNQAQLPEDLRDGAQLVRDRPAKPLRPSLAHLFPVRQHRRRLAGGLGALLDLALFAQYCLDDDALFGPAVLLREEGTRMAKTSPPWPASSASRAPPASPSSRLPPARSAECGYRLRDQPDFAEMAELRANYQGCVDAIAEHLGKPAALLIRAR